MIYAVETCHLVQRSRSCVSSQRLRQSSNQQGLRLSRIEHGIDIILIRTPSSPVLNGKGCGKVATSYRYAAFIVVMLIQQFVCLSGSHTLALHYNTQLSQRDRATLCVSWNLVNCCKITSEKAYNRWTTLKVTEGHRKWRYSIGHMSLPVSGL